MNLEELEKLNELKEKGIITQEEFDKKKKEMLNGHKENISQSDKGKNIWNNYLSCWEKSFQFLGRATRYEFWGFVFINTLISFVLSLIDISAETGGILNGIFTLIILVPTVAVTVRRLHDVNKSALALLLPFLCLILLTIVFHKNNVLVGLFALIITIYFIYLLCQTCKKSYADKNEYGENLAEDKFDQIAKRLMIALIILYLLPVLGLLIIGGSAGFSSASSRYKLNKNIDQISIIVTNIRALYQGYETYDGLDNRFAKKIYVVPSDMYSDQTDDKITNAFGTETIIHGEGSTFSITYANLSEEQCLKIYTGDWGDNFVGVLINGNTFDNCSTCPECYLSLVFN